MEWHPGLLEEPREIPPEEDQEENEERMAKNDEICVRCRHYSEDHTLAGECIRCGCKHFQCKHFQITDWNKIRT